ncbi:MAG: hypothetical protein AMXMBFR55_16180 [Gemmatimonadota bacterium]
MKLALLLLTAATLGAGVCDLCQSSAALAPPATLLASTPSAEMDTVVLHVEGMTCGGCTIATRKVLERLTGVTMAEVSYEERRAVVTYDPRKVTVAQMIAAVATLKYTATEVTSGARPAATRARS